MICILISGLTSSSNRKKKKILDRESMRKNLPDRLRKTSELTRGRERLNETEIRSWEQETFEKTVKGTQKFGQIQTEFLIKMKLLLSYWKDQSVGKKCYTSCARKIFRIKKL